MQLNKLNSCIFLRRVYIQILNTLPYRAKKYLNYIFIHLLWLLQFYVFGSA